MRPDGSLKPLNVKIDSFNSTYDILQELKVKKDENKNKSTK